MDIHVISLRRRTDRRERFLAWNRREGLSFSFFDAVEGSLELRSDLISQGLLLDEANLFTLGSLGTAMSHLTLWKRCISARTNFLIAEDDACLRSDFSAMLGHVIAAAGEDWDIIYLGCNTDAMLALLEDDGSISPFGFNDAVKTESGFFDEFSKFEYDAELPRVARCCQVWGLLAYVVSPMGAGKLKERCFPLDSRNRIEMLGENRTIWPTSFDGMVNLAIRKDVRSFCCVPPLVLGPNDQSDSDTRNVKHVGVSRTRRSASLRAKRGEGRKS